MTRLITYLAILLTLQINCNGQSFFNLTDSVFEVGQIKKIQIVYELSGGCHPTIKSLPILDSIVDFLKMNKNLKIEIGTHTDYRADSTLNEYLSKLRAKRVKEYFIKKGIEITRLEHKGYGEYYPIVVDKKINEKYTFLPIGQELTENYIKKLDSVEKQEIANMLNRRTEIKIIDNTNRQ
jgi:outer membrane protein OmpA-like peptidoglycan-associated protein